MGLVGLMAGGARSIRCAAECHGRLLPPPGAGARGFLLKKTDIF